MASFEPRPGHNDEVLFAHEGASGRIRLNRPRAINALNPAMVAAITEQLHDWAGDDTVHHVVIDGAGERGLCAGGDIKALHAALLEGRPEAMQFWADEYAMDALIATYPKPTVALMDGVVMGGGLGLAGYCSFRVVTDRSMIAMPEVRIGFFPDVGARFQLARAGALGTHLALTGDAVGAGDAIAAGLADVLLTDERITEMVQGLAEDAPLRRVTGDPAPTVLAGQPWLEQCYDHDDLATVLQRLESHDDPAARQAGATIRTRSPLSVAVTWEGLRRARHMTLLEVLDADGELARRFGEVPDFREGIRAQVIDKDHDPHWSHSRVEDVTADEVAALLGPDA